ncbi:taste receptor type 1 member 1-like [Oryzias melastigma]|uniref:taste receptor type 1 member 1-like n=1 Tax=Oryzias melastigma TaxID=30732 RepID=UPI000CF7E5EF|nr:taste receptor type 1 member 1-like [Oryzias melastigma]
MKVSLTLLCLFEGFLQATAQSAGQTSEFHLGGDYLIGGLFNIHYVATAHFQRPQAIDCSSKLFILPNYRRFQLMRFSVEEINNSTVLLPNISLGYQMFDHCSDIHSFPGLFKLLSVKDSIRPLEEGSMRLPNVIGVVGPFTSTHALTVAPIFMSNLFPMVSYGCSGSVFSRKNLYPSFLRTVHPNKDVINAIVGIIQNFSWRWVAFLNSDDDFGKDGLEQFKARIEESDICLAYYKSINHDTDYSQVFKQLEEQNIKVIVVFAPKVYAEAVIESAVQLNVTNKVWIADDGWSLNKKLPNMEGIQNIGTVLGVAQPVVTIPGFTDFIYSATSQRVHGGDTEQEMFCNQKCSCSNVSVKSLLRADPSFSFPVYAAVYAIAHALHNTLRCGSGTCHRNITVYPQMILEELKKSNFTLLNQAVQFDENGDPKFGSLSIVFWNHSGEAEEVGFYHFQQSTHLSINKTKIKWFTNGEVPTALCSSECPAGYAKKPNGIHKCCFSCEICKTKTYINITENPFRCISCKDTEWSAEGSTSCTPRLLEYVLFTDSGAMLTMVLEGLLLGLIVSVSAVFAINYNTPVVRSAGGPICFLNLGCLSLCSISVFFYFGVPTPAFCVLRYLPFILFYTVCLSCFVVRSFQIVCIFKISAQIPNIHIWWVKYHGQWLLISAAFVFQAVSITISFSCDPPSPYNETSWYPEQIILSCNLNIQASICSLLLLLSLCCLCFIFSYMAKDLPKNYNEAKAITFCLLLLTCTWVIFITEYMLYRGKYIQIFNALAVLSSLYSFLLWYFLPKCYIIIFQPSRNTQQYFQGLIQNYTKTISQ